MKRMLCFVLILALFLSIPANASSNANVTVYVTDSGYCYHRNGCSYLLSKNSISLQDAVDAGYSRCSRCDPPKLGTRKSTDDDPYLSGGQEGTSGKAHKGYNEYVPSSTTPAPTPTPTPKTTSTFAPPLAIEDMAGETEEKREEWPIWGIVFIVAFFAVCIFYQPICMFFIDLHLKKKKKRSEKANNEDKL